MHHFSEFLAIQHLNVPHLRGRTGTCKGTREATREKEKENETGGVTEKKRSESTEEVGTPDEVGKVKKDRADWKVKAKT